MEEEKKIGEWKDMMVMELSEKIKDNSDFYLSEYIGLKADELNELKRLLEPFSSKYIVLKNSIAKIAFEKAGLGKLTNLIEGGTAIAFGGKDPVATAKAISTFSKSHNSLKLKGGYLDGDIIDGDKIKYLASLPSRDGLIAQVVFTLKSPISGFAGVLGNTLKKLMYAIQAIKDKKGG